MNDCEIWDDREEEENNLLAVEISFTSAGTSSWFVDECGGVVLSSTGMLSWLMEAVGVVLSCIGLLNGSNGISTCADL